MWVPSRRSEKEMRDGTIPVSFSMSGHSTQGCIACISYICFPFILFLYTWTQPSGLRHVGTQWRLRTFLWACPKTYTLISVELFLSPKHVHLVFSTILIKPGKNKIKHLNNGQTRLYRHRAFCLVQLDHVVLSTSPYSCEQKSESGICKTICKTH